MQDLRSTGGSGGRLFAGDRRLRHHPNQALKCPRCESANTKFCYYNNYNLSQPRHFCKSCGRYWTKGGVLRNVPVGGGCRKTKRSKLKSSTEVQKDKITTSQSSSDNSGLTVATTPATTEIASATNFSDRSLNFLPSVMETLSKSPDSKIFPETVNFTLTASNPAFLGFDFSEFSQQSQKEQIQQQKRTSMVEEMKSEELTSIGYDLDQTVPVEFPDLARRMSQGGLTALDWQSSGDQGLFDLPSSVDEGNWNQSQWYENYNSLYFP